MRGLLITVAALVGACGSQVRAPADTACEELEVGALCSFVGRRGPVVGVCERIGGRDETTCRLPPIAEERLACVGAARGERCAFEAALGRVEGVCAGVELVCRAEAPRARRFEAELCG